MECASSSGGEEEEAWNDVERDYRCLHCARACAAKEDLFAHLSEAHEFDLKKVFEEVCDGLYDRMKLVNCVRMHASHGTALRAEQFLSKDFVQWKNEEYLLPFLEDDKLLMELDTLFGPLADEEQEDTDGVRWKALALEAQQECLDLRAQLVEAGKLLGLDEDPREADSYVENLEQTPSSILEKGNPTLDMKSKISGPRGRYAVGRCSSSKVDENYFASYSDMAIHREMLGDRPRTLGYQSAIDFNAESLIKGANVMDIGCGTGILSLMAARAGAASVVAVDASETMAAATRANAIENGYKEEVQILNQRVETIENLPKDLKSVDVIVSEWMGYGLLFESMLDDVIVARDRWLKPGGAVLPDIATLYVAGGSAKSARDWFWRDVYGFRMSEMGRRARSDALRHALVEHVDPSNLVTESHAFREIDIVLDPVESLEFTAPFELKSKLEQGCGAGAGSTADSEEATTCSVLVLWFDAHFSSRFCKENPVTLSTGPHAHPTHWAQVVLTLSHPVPLSKDVIFIKGSIGFSKNKDNHRSIDIVVTYGGSTRDGTDLERHTQLFII